MTMPSNIQKWDDVRADFRDSNQMFRSAQEGISNVGTIFGQLRASILAEEQKAVDNAFREKQLSENIKQFGLTHALKQDEFGETKRRNLVLEEDADLDRTQRGNIADLNYRASMAGVAAQNRNTALREKAYQDQQNLLAIQTKVHQDILGEANALEKEKANLTASINSGTLTGDSLTASQARLKQIDDIIRTDYTASALDKRIGNEIAIRGGGIVPATSMSNEATAEQARTTANIEMAKAYAQSQLKANEIPTKLNLGQEDSAALQRAMSLVQQKYPTLKPEIAMSILTSYYPTTGEIISGGPFNMFGQPKNKFDVPITEKDYIVKFDPTDSNNPIAVRLAQAVGKGENLLSDGKEIKPTNSPPPVEPPINLSSLTDEALANEREQILASKPSEPTSEQIEERYKQLLRTSWGNTPKDKIPKTALETLKEKALQDAKAAIQKERIQATRKVDNEISARQNAEMLNKALYMMQ